MISFCDQTFLFTQRQKTQTKNIQRLRTATAGSNMYRKSISHNGEKIASKATAPVGSYGLGASYIQVLSGIATYRTNKKRPQKTSARLPPPLLYS